MTESVIINRLGKGENKVNFILILPPPLPLFTPSRPVSNIDLQRSLFVSLKGNFSHICFHCAPFFERSSFSPYYLLLYSSNYYIDKYRCYCDLCFSHFKEILDSPACRYNICNIVVNITSPTGEVSNIPCKPYQLQRSASFLWWIDGNFFHLCSWTDEILDKTFGGQNTDLQKQTNLKHDSCTSFLKNVFH